MRKVYERHTNTSTYFIIAFIVSFTIPVYSQVQVVLELPPPFKFKIEDMWKLSIINPSTQSQVYLHGTIENINDGVLIAEAKTSSFNLPSGMKKVTSADISPVDLTKYSDEADKTIDKLGTLPNGEYRICVEVISSETNLVLGLTCSDISVLTLTQPELLSPADGETILEFFPIFNWLPAVPLTSGVDVTYDIIITEILERQTPEYALLSNPFWFIQQGIRNNLFQLPSGSRQMINGQRYAWQLKTYANDILLSESEIREFVYENITSDIEKRNLQIKKQLDKELMKEHAVSQESLTTESISNNSVDKVFKDLPSGLSGKNLLVSSSNKILYTNQTPLNTSVIVTRPNNEIKPFEFFGSYNVDYQYSNLQGIGSQIPRNYLNLRIDPTVLIYGLPLSVNLFYSTQQQDSRQNINSISFLLDSRYLNKKSIEQANEQLSEMQKEAERKEQELQQNMVNLSLEEVERLNSEIEAERQKIEALKKNPKKSLSGSQEFFSSFKSLGFGMNYPRYTKYTLDGARVTGLNLEMNTGWFYLAISGWNNLEAVPGSSYSRNLLAGRIGAGSTDDTHLHLTMMKAYDDENTLTAVDIPSFLTPSENVVIGTDASLYLFNNLLKVGGEFAGSMYTRDVNSAELVSDDIPEFVKSISDVNMSSQVDYSYEFFSEVDIKDTDSKLKAVYKMVGPGYISLGAPGIRRDVSGFDVKLNQILFNRIVSFTVQFARERNNLISQSSSTSTYSKYGFNLKINFKDAPYIIIDYRPNFVSNDLKTDSLIAENSAHVFSLMTGLNVFEDYLTSSTNLVFLIQSSTSNIEINNLSLFNITVSENLLFTFPLSISGSLGYIEYSPADYSTIIIDFSAGYIFFNLWRNSIGINYVSEAERNTKSGIYFTSRIAVWEIGDLFISLNQNFYREAVIVYGAREEFILRAGISKSLSY